MSNQDEVFCELLNKLCNIKDDDELIFNECYKMTHTFKINNYKHYYLRLSYIGSPSNEKRNQLILKQFKIFNEAYLYRFSKYRKLISYYKEKPIMKEFSNLTNINNPTFYNFFKNLKFENKQLIINAIEEHIIERS